MGPIDSVHQKQVRRLHDSFLRLQAQKRPVRLRPLCGRSATRPHPGHPDLFAGSLEAAVPLWRNIARVRVNLATRGPLHIPKKCTGASDRLKAGTVTLKRRGELDRHR